MIALTPPLGLVVIDAPRIQTQVAPDRAILAMRRPGHLGCGLGNGSIGMRKIIVLRNVAKPDTGANTGPAFVRFDPVESLDSRQINQGRRSFDAAADIDDHVGSAGKETRVGIGCFQGNGVSNRIRAMQRKLRKKFHARSYSAACRLADRW